MQLDDSAKALFEELGGIEARQKYSLDGLAQSLEDEQKRQDKWRLQLIQAAILISTQFMDIRLLKNKDEYSIAFEKLHKTLKQLSAMPDADDKIIIRYRGNPESPSTPEKFDYEILFSHLMVNTAVVPSIIKRTGGKNPQLGDQLLQAFTLFSKWGLNNLYIRLPKGGQADMMQLHICLRLLMQYKRAKSKGVPLVISQGGKKRQIPIVLDETGQPDLNLTLVAGINQLNSTTMDGLVQKVGSWMQKDGGDNGEKALVYTSVFNAMYDIEKISQKLKKPLLEINNIKWLMLLKSDDIITQEKAHVARLALSKSGGSPEKVAEVIKSVYGDDYGKIDSKKLNKRINLSSELLHSIEEEPDNEGIKSEVLENIHRRLDTVEDSFFDNIYVQREDDPEIEDDKNNVILRVHQQLYKMVTFFKGRSATHKKMKSVTANPMSFTDTDFETIATDFNISTEEAIALVDHLKNCFSANGRFRKSAFNAAIDHFICYEKKIFQFLWHHMKDVVLNEDRTAFLNALQTLASRMEQPKKAFKILLEDFTREPSVINFSDNKALMLANLVLHRYDTLADIEMTPDDIILERLQLDHKVAGYASWRIDRDQERFFEKVRTIHNKLNESLERGKTHREQFTSGHMINLERELYIFLSLVEGKTGPCVLRSGVQEYGNPQAEVFALPHSELQMQLLIQNLRVTLHGIGSIGAMEDIGLLEQVKQNEEEFIHLKKSKDHRAQARMITEWANNAIKHIKYRR